jgi:hypothetical protein
MANPPIGNHFMEGVIGVVNVEWNGVDYGKTTADTEIVVDQDIKDIIYQQDGTKYADKVRTGIVYQVNVTFGEIDNALLASLDQGITASGGGDSLKMGRDLYQSWKDTFANSLVLKRVDSDGVSSTDPLFWATFYKAAPEVTGSIPYGADTQRAVTVTFHVFYDDTNGAFGYTGYASSLGL